MNLTENEGLTERPAEGTIEGQGRKGTSFRPFRIKVPQAELDGLRDRLTRTRWPDELPGVGWNYGIPLAYVKELADYWRSSYDWHHQEAMLNELPQFTTTIDGANVHLVHVRSAEPEALPLIITHGWPGSFVEFLKIIGPLTDPVAYGGNAADAFDLVIPSIPGFGFSGPTHETGWHPRRVAQAWVELMRRLGYQRYGAQGGDWGSAISEDVGLLDVDHVVGIHLNTLTTLPSDDPSEMTSLTDAERARLDRMANFRDRGLGYAQLQGTRPQTMAYALTDSPVGQLAWIVEKFKEWTDSGERPEDAVDRDQMLTNVTIYWLTKTANSSARIYYENAMARGAWGRREPSTVPLGVAVFPYDLAPAIRSFAERDKRNLVHWSEFDRGGHFAAMEAPDLLVGDIRAFFRRLR